jgi:hypothetical protein
LEIPLVAGAGAQMPVRTALWGGADSRNSIEITGNFWNSMEGLSASDWREMARHFAEKLRLTAAVLGCASQKDLCAAFLRVNPNTDFALQRSYKWIRGRALPRSARVYEDWAKVLAIGQSATWLASCTLEELIEALCARDPGTSRAALLARAGLPEHGPAAGADDSYLCGAYACYSHAQSPYFRGRIVRGALIVEPAGRPAAALGATYAQALPTGRAHASGAVLLFGRAMCLDLRAPSAGMAPLFFSLYLPIPPASVLAGVMCGTTALDPSGQPPYATRIVMVRVPPPAAAGLEASNRYIDAAMDPLSRDLAALGVLDGDTPPEALDALLAEVLSAGGGNGHLRLPAEDYARLTQVFDRLLIESAARAVE